MKKEYILDGRDPDAQGYVNLNRESDRNEIDAATDALSEFGWTDDEICDTRFRTIGALDDVHGWRLLELTKIDGDGKPQYLILGDVLDVLEAPYNKVLTLDEVMEFARTTGSGENIGTAYEAMQEWGVFHSLSDGLRDMLGVRGVCMENERASWDEKRGEWKLSWDVIFDPQLVAEGRETITIPAQLESCETADREFYSEWRALCLAYNAVTGHEYFIDACEVTVDFALKLAERKERELFEIRDAIEGYLEGVIERAQRKEPGSKDGRVWVLTIKKDEMLFPEVHKTLDGALDGAVNDIAEHMEEDEVDDYDWAKIRKELESQHYWHDDIKDVVYDIAECGVND